MESKVGSMLLITANVGSLFEHPRMIQGWCTEMLNVLQKHNPNIVAFGFQVRFFNVLCGLFVIFYVV